MHKNSEFIEATYLCITTALAKEAPNVFALYFFIFEKNRKCTFAWLHFSDVFIELDLKLAAYEAEECQNAELDFLNIIWV